MSADADKCYDRINHIIILLLLLAIVGCIGNVAMLHPIQTMTFFQRAARGDSTTFMVGRGKDNPLQGLCQGNGAAPACWLMLSSILMHCYQCQGFGLRIISPISGAIALTSWEKYMLMTRTSSSQGQSLIQHRVHRRVFAMLLGPGHWA
jgi:hypothetical protein